MSIKSLDSSELSLLSKYVNPIRNFRLRANMLSNDDRLRSLAKCSQEFTEILEKYVANIESETLTKKELIPLFQELLIRVQDPNPHIAQAANQVLEWIDKNHKDLRGENDMKFMKLIQATTDDQQLWAAFGDWWIKKHIVPFFNSNMDSVFERLKSNPHLLNVMIDGRTFLSRAISNGMTDRVQMLLEAGANPYLKSNTPPNNRDSFEYFIQYQDEIKRKISSQNFERLKELVLNADTQNLYKNQLQGQSLNTLMVNPSVQSLNVSAESSRQRAEDLQMRASNQPSYTPSNISFKPDDSNQQTSEDRLRAIADRSRQRAEELQTRMRASNQPSYTPSNISFESSFKPDDSNQQTSEDRLRAIAERSRQRQAELLKIQQQLAGKK